MGGTQPSLLHLGQRSLEADHPAILADNEGTQLVRSINYFLLVLGDQADWSLDSAVTSFNVFPPGLYIFYLLYDLYFSWWAVLCWQYQHRKLYSNLCFAAWQNSLFSICICLKIFLLDLMHFAFWEQNDANIFFSWFSTSTNSSSFSHFLLSY